MTGAGDVGASPAPAPSDDELRILAEPDPLKRAEAAFEYVRLLAAHLEGKEPTERAMMRATGESSYIAGQQRVHVELAHASAMLAIAIELRGLRRVLDDRLRRPT